MRVALIDYGAGNLHSVHNALKAAGAGHVTVTAAHSGSFCRAWARSGRAVMACSASPAWSRRWKRR